MASAAGRPSSQDPLERHERRIQELEFVVTHLQKTAEDLNKGMLLQQKTIDVLCRQMEQAKSDVRSMMGIDNSARTAADDKPPHY